MSAGQDITTGPGGGNPLLVNPRPIIPVVPVLPVVPSNPTRSDYNEAARPVSERTLTIAGAGTLLPTIFGLTRRAPKITAIVDYGANLVLRCEWCTGGIDSVNALYMDDAAAPAGVIATHHSGSQVTADPTLVAAFAAKGKPYTDTPQRRVLPTLVVPPGLGNGFRVLLPKSKGKKIAQTSGGTPAYTQNGVWFIAWLITPALARVDQLGVFHCGGDSVWRHDDRLSRREEAHPRPDARQRAKRHTVDFAAARLHRLRAVVRQRRVGITAETATLHRAVLRHRSADEGRRD